MENIDKLRFAILNDCISTYKKWVKELYCPIRRKDGKRKFTIEIVKGNIRFELGFAGSDWFVYLMGGNDLRKELTDKLINYIYYFYYIKKKKKLNPYYEKFNLKEKMYGTN